MLGEKAFAHSGKELSLMLDWMLAFTDAGPAQIVVAIEIPHGPVVDSLLDRGFRVFSINPKQLDRFRDRFSPAGAKDDRRDARVLADALRTDPDCLRELDPLDGSVVELREWSRMSDELTTERTRLTNQVRAAVVAVLPAGSGTRLCTAFAGDPRPLDAHSDASTSPSRSTSFGGEDLKKAPDPSDQCSGGSPNSSSQTDHGCGRGRERCHGSDPTDSRTACIVREADPRSGPSHRRPPRHA